MEMSKLVIRNALFFGYEKFSKLIIPWATFTHPEVSHVGLYEQDCQKQGIKYDVWKVDLHENDRAICDGENEGFVKILCKKGKDTILGATIVAENAGEMINEISVCMVNSIGLEGINQTIHPYPTVSEAIREAATNRQLAKYT